MYHSPRLSSKINTLQENCAGLIYKYKKSTFQDKGTYVSIHKSTKICNWNVQFNQDFYPRHFFECFYRNKQTKLQSASCLTLRCASSKLWLQWNWKYLIYGIQNLGYITQQDNGDKNSGSTPRWHNKNRNRKTACLDFVSAIWLESDLPDTYLQGQSLLVGRYFTFY